MILISIDVMTSLVSYIILTGFALCYGSNHEEHICIHDKVFNRVGFYINTHVLTKMGVAIFETAAFNNPNV